MIYKDKNWIYVTAMVGLLSATSCSNLEEEVFSQPAPENVFASAGAVENVILGMYQPLNSAGDVHFQNRGWFLNTATDEGDTYNFNGGWGEFDLLSYTPSSQGTADEIYNFWKSSYRSVAATNLILDNEDQIKALFETDPEKADAVLAEAHFMRAYNYFDLVRVFGGVPLRLTIPQRFDEINIPRATEQEVYNQIFEDFRFAEQNLPKIPARTGQPVQMTVTAFLAKVDLTLQDYQSALAKAQAVVNSGLYSLQSSFGDIFNINNEYNSEVIFDVSFIRVNNLGSRFSKTWTLGEAANPNGGWGLAFMEEEMFGRYSVADKRRPITFLTDDSIGGNFWTGKFIDPAALDADGAENNFIVYRYSDLLLVLAEAANEIGDQGEAYSAINQVRNRAELANLTPGLSQAAFRDSVLSERNLELAYEQHRWFDLKRTGKLREANEALDKDGLVWNDRVLLFPIPQAEIDASNGVLEQNPGY